MPPKKRTWRSGFCTNGQHEGQRPKSFRGTPLPICLAWESCTCPCHAEVTKMYEMIGQPRPPAEQNPDYKPEKSTFVLPDPPVPAVAFEGVTPVVHVIDEVADMPPPAPQVTPSSVPTTPTGLRAKGSLEHQVLAAVNAWGGEEEHGPCTPKVCAEWIVGRYGGTTPSTGAIQAVWDRWEKLGIAEQAKKPARFVTWCDGFTGDATDLERRKAAKKRAAKAAKTAQARGFR